MLLLCLLLLLLLHFFNFNLRCCCRCWGCCCCCCWFMATFGNNACHTKVIDWHLWKCQQNIDGSRRFILLPPFKLPLSLPLQSVPLCSCCCRRIVFYAKLWFMWECRRGVCVCVCVTRWQHVASCCCCALLLAAAAPIALSCAFCLHFAFGFCIVISHLVWLVLVFLAVCLSSPVVVAVFLLRL